MPAASIASKAWLTAEVLAASNVSGEGSRSHVSAKPHRDPTTQQGQTRLYRFLQLLLLFFLPLQNLIVWIFYSKCLDKRCVLTTLMYEFSGMLFKKSSMFRMFLFQNKLRFKSKFPKQTPESWRVSGRAPIQLPRVSGTFTNLSFAGLSVRVARRERATAEAFLISETCRGGEVGQQQQQQQEAGSRNQEAETETNNTQPLADSIRLYFASFWNRKNDTCHLPLHRIWLCAYFADNAGILLFTCAQEFTPTNPGFQVQTGMPHSTGESFLQPPFSPCHGSFLLRLERWGLSCLCTTL